MNVPKTGNANRTSQGDYGFDHTVDAKAEDSRDYMSEVGYCIRRILGRLGKRVQFLEVAPMNGGRGLVSHSEFPNMDSQQCQTYLMGDRMTLQETVWIVEEEAYASREVWAQSIGLSQATHQELQTHCDHVYAHETHIRAHQAHLQLQSTLIQTQHQAELLAHQEQQRRARQPGPEARILDHQDATGMLPLPPVDLPTTESLGYVTESDPEEDQEEYEDDETEDGPVDYPMDGGDDDDDDSSGDDADDEDEEDEEEEISSADSLITVRLQASISLPPEAEVERLLAMPTPSPSPPISLSPPSAGERLARIASTQALIDAVTAALPSPPLPPLPPSLYIPPPVDHRDDLPEFELPPRKRLCLSTLGLNEVGYGIRDTWVDPAEAVPEITPMTLGEVNTRVTKLAELHEHDTHDLYALLEDAHEGRTRISQRVTIDSQRVDLLIKDMIAYQETIQIAEMAVLRETDRRRQTQMVETLRVMRDMRREMSDMQAELLAHREQQRRARQPGSDARAPDHQEASRDTDSHI
ncbi:hypothetical protein Tco_1243999 [Tanacetum coccineum]